ncbi:MAG: ABC transporter permease [Candidatus Bathyarchaeia archaeon]
MTLRKYLAKRIVVGIITLFIVATLNFVIFVLQPSDPTRYLLQPGMKPEQKEMIAREYGLRDPLDVRYLKYLRNMFSYGLIPPYFGISFKSKQTVASEMSWRMQLTVLLLGSAMIGRTIVGIPAGIFAAAKRGGKLDVAIMGCALLTFGIPIFVLQLLSIFFFSYLANIYGIRIFPTGGGLGGPYNSFWEFLPGAAWHLSLPILVLTFGGFGGWALYTRNMLIDALTQDYIVTARAKGLSERTVLYKHAFKSILPPVATMITLSIPGIVTGAIITETIFGLEGIGKWYVESLSRGSPNYPVVQAVLFIFATLTIMFNIIADLLYGVLDPRIRVGARR